MKKDENDLAINILSNKITNLLGNFADIEEDSRQGEILQEKIETLVEVKDQISMGNNELAKKVIQKRNDGIL